IQFAPRQSEWRVSLKSAADWMLGLGVIAAVAAVGAGLQAYYSVAHDGPSHEAMTFHRNIAIPTAGVFVLLGLWRWAARKNFPSLVFSLAMLLASAALATTAWWGGKLVYGYGLGVASLPQATGEGHDHEQAPGQGHGDETETASAEGQDDGHDHGDADDHSAGDHDHDETAAAEPGTGGAEPAAAFDADNYPETPKAVVEAYGAALKAKDEAAIRGMLSPDVIIAEGGGAERSVEEYAGHHMPADMEFTAVVEFSVKKRDVIANDEIATVISESQVHGTFRGENVHSRMMETMVLRREDDRWRIVHIHWSSAPIAGEHEH
ncbi:MAG: nuclear transport factor 2 family protein, partial [Bryobacterales bacterium]